MKAYIITLLAAALTVTVASMLLPEGNMKKYAQLVSSVMISLSVIAPLKTVLNINEIFESDGFSAYEMTKEEAERIYTDNLKEELKKNVEESLSEYGRAYATVSDELTVTLIEIYTDTPLSDEEKENIEELYAPERLEIIYGES